MTSIERHSLTAERQLTEQLKAKSRRRRDDLARLAALSVVGRPRRNDLLPALDVFNVPLDDLRLPTRKVRDCNPSHVRDVAGSISALGFCVPVLIGTDNLVVDGVVRVEAARLLDLGRVPCIRIDHLSEIEQRTLRLAVNRLAEKGQWNLDELKIEFEELILTDAPIEITGFSPDEIDHIVLGDPGDAIEQGPLSPEADAVPVASLSDVFQLGPHRIVCGSASEAETLRLLMHGDGPARVVLTDEPYNVPIAGQ
jgi:hypothetical protein